jgi:Flp pilus assembly pilin Flp
MSTRRRVFFEAYIQQEKGCFVLTSMTITVLARAARLGQRLRGERGQDLIEYSMLGGILAASIVGVAYVFLTGSIESMFTGIGNCLDWDGDTGCFP